MNENLNEIQTLKPFTKILMTIGELPTSYLMTMSYYEQVVWLCNYIGKNVIPALNNNAEATRELQLKYIELKNYVETYFDNLDIQTEINNKLDEMAESGELTDIIAQYLQLAGILAFNTLSDLANAENLSNGSFTKIYGKVTYNDGYGAFYKIRALINTDIIDGDNLVALVNYPTLVAEKMSDATINSILSNLSTININISDINTNKISAGGIYKGKNLVTFGDSWTDPDNVNSEYGHWVNRVAQATGMTAFNFGKGASSFLRPNNSIRMQVTRALEMTTQQKNNTSVIIIFSPDTDILENTTRNDWLTEVEDLLNTLHTNYPNAKIIFAGFTWRVNQLYSEYNEKMIDFLFALQRQCSYLPLEIIKYASYWLLGLTGYYKDQYHPNTSGYNIIAGHFLNAIYGGPDEIRDIYNVSSLFNYENSEDRRLIVDVFQDKVSIQFHTSFNQALTNYSDFINYFPTIAIPQPDIILPVMTAGGECVGTFRITGPERRAYLNIPSLPANTFIFVSGEYRAQANVPYSS